MLGITKFPAIAVQKKAGPWFTGQKRGPGTKTNVKACGPPFTSWGPLARSIYTRGLFWGFLSSLGQQHPPLMPLILMDTLM